MSFSSAIVALGGGVLIGLAATLFLLFNGRIAGISTIVAGLWRIPLEGGPWSWFFVLGLVSGGASLLWLFPQAFETGSPDSLARFVLGGLLVGFGARVGSGCTSGHGVCGLSRRSLRSLIATFTFILTGMATVYLTAHVAT